MRSIECEGETIDEAIANALRALEIERDRVEIEILNDATRGLFGFGGTKARVRATVRSPAWSGFPDDSAGIPRNVSWGTSGEVASATPGPRSTGDGRISPRRAMSRSTSGPPAAEEPGHRGRTRSDATSGTEVAASQAFVSRCTAVLAEVLGHIGVSCIIEPRPGEEPGVTILDVTGDSSGLLIGRRGQTLDALDYLINRVVARPGADSSGRVVIDVEHYRERRREYLETLARRLGEKAKQTRRVVTLNPMSPRDRRVVHLALQDDQALATRSQGDGYYRKVLILPAAGRRPSRSGREVG